MRDERTADEASAVKALKRYMLSSGFDECQEVEGWLDNPDILLKTSIGRIACEVATVVPDKVIQWYFKKLPELPPGSARQIVVPREPHEWAKIIIKKKRKKLTQYKARTKTGKIWLLIHSSSRVSNILQPACSEDIELLRYSAHEISHGFKKILFYDGAGDIVELYDHKRRETININYEFLRSGYPTYTTWTGSMGKISHVEKDMVSEIEIDFAKLMVDDQIILPPFDSEYTKVKPIISPPKENPKLLIGTRTASSKKVDPKNIFPEYHENIGKRE